MRSILALFFILLFLSGCSGVFYQPTRKHFLDPRKEFKLEYQDLTFESRDGTKLHGWFVPSKVKPVKGTVIQFHGNARNISTHLFSLVWMIEQGYNVFTFDYRGYGKSGGEASQLGVHEDALAALKRGLKLRNENGGGKYIVFGQSLGGNIAMRGLADFEDKNQVDLLVMDSTFGSYQDIAFYKASHNWLLFLVSPLTYLLISDRYAADDVAEKVRIPVLVIVGEKDEVIPPQFGKKIYRSLKTKRRWLWKLEEGRHIDVFFIEKGRHRLRFMHLLDQLGQS